jgi:2-aminophenol/2-amino-5-chlorophenol 1,6-dioxygenase beta subunit
MSAGIVAGVLAPHPPHLVYADNPPQNEPRAECGWEVLRWGYERLRKDLEAVEHDVLIVLSPHWQTYIGTHALGVARFESRSVDPVFPNLFRYDYALDVDVPLAERIVEAASDHGLVTKLMRNPDFRVDYGTIVSCHLVDPGWSRPIVSLSSCRSSAYYNVDVMQAQARTLGVATREAVASLGRRAVLLASNSLSHRHFTTESDVPEDMSREHIESHAQYLWDMKLVEMMKQGRTSELVDLMPDFTTQAIAETDAGSFTWMLSALGLPDYPAEIYAYGTVIGTGNAVAGWFPEEPVR